ncbi:hypothetical protein [Ralstonia solanacearum]|uniref:hypothetical protein n=1 Tax=Ralstonia solanacearum TaxID=305 RepID=UPI0005AC63D8|nr:hypothetical protein [Ralstonia solanacearum]MDC6177061.1 hypothetical protein [Ralstonia solanacearum]MDC6238407.1 hypothetical protein [Ralstonia solanacearum]
MRSLLVFSAVAALATSAFAQSGPDHAAHHPDSASAAATVSVEAPAQTAVPAAASGMGMSMANMQQMHDRMHGHGQSAMHDKMMDNQMKDMPPSPAASK